MENIVNRLIGIGYSEPRAKSLFALYDKNGNLTGLREYIEAKEKIAKLLEKVEGNAWRENT